MTRRRVIVLLLAAMALAVVYVGLRTRTQDEAPALTKVRFGISPFQDTLVPIVGREKGWYREEGLDVEFTVLGWTEVMEALSAGHVDVAINNISSVVATHNQNPDIVYWYGLNPFDNGFALMIRPNGPLRTLAQIQAESKDRDEAIRRTAAQLKGRTVITTSKTDMEQGVAAAARRGGLDFIRDVKIIDQNPDEGLALFLRGDGDAYIGGIPQRTRAGKEGAVEMLTGADLGPPPINGFVTRDSYAKQNPEVLTKLLRVWFRIVNDINRNIDDGGGIIVKTLNASSAANFRIDDFKRFWNNYEHYPANPKEVEQLILDPKGRNYWRARWDDCNLYFFEITKAIPKPVTPEQAFRMEQAHRQYVEKYGSQ
jgi:NitT/TauT family transport system substrate-binding protein